MTSLKRDKVVFPRPPPLQERVTSRVTLGRFQENIQRQAGAELCQAQPQAVLTASLSLAVH